MLEYIRAKNLRSIKEQKVQISPLTILYGANGSGKSTLMHSLSILKNIVLNPGQPVDSFFNLGFASFGGFRQVVFSHATESQMELEIGCVAETSKVSYKVVLGKQAGRFEIRSVSPMQVNIELDTSFPYGANQPVSSTAKAGEITLGVNWNGILAQVTAPVDKPDLKALADMLARTLNAPIELLRSSDFVHLKRGFSKPNYGPVPLAPSIHTEDDVATLLANDQYLEPKVSRYLEQIFNRDLRVRTALGTSLFSLNTSDKATGLATELVNDGSGINQLAYLLAKILHSDVTVSCIEEPEIHLHPKAVRDLGDALVTIIKEERKTLIVSTHSEHLVLTVLGAVSKGLLKPTDLACYLCTKDKEGSRFERQTVNESGQIEGGLSSFMEGELEDLRDILGAPKGRD